MTDPDLPAASGTPAAPAATSPRAPRLAATIVVVRDGPRGIEVLLSRRAERGDHNSGAWVFPGGLVDPGDGRAHACCAGLTDGEASARLGVPSGGLDFYVAAVRECFEESGLLFAADADGAVLRPDAALAGRLAPWRRVLHAGEQTIVDLCAEFGLRFAVEQLVYFSHWITPSVRPKRFDTRFFLAAAPPGQIAVHDGTEMVEQRWLTSAEALHETAALKLLTPTQATLQLIGRYPDVEGLLAWARSGRAVRVTEPRVGMGRQGARPVLPDEPAYAEIGRLDPLGRGTAAFEIHPGRAVCLSPRIVRVSANNGSVMTGPGTNSYFVGGGAENEWALIDPGPLLDAHVEALLAAAPGPVRWIFATHTHLDHSPAVQPLRAATGARVFGRLAVHPEWQDGSFVPDVVLDGGERIALPGETTLRVIHTPGHASNHLCYLLEEEKTLFTGDHLMQASTVVINPPDGDMQAYLASLRSLLDLDLEWLAPGHGFLMADPHGAVRAVIDHRLKREARVVAALQARPGATADDLLPVVYADVPQRLHKMALRSLAAHLLKLQADGSAAEHAGRWSLRA